ncbi:MAG TPA: hypothetical protein VGN15_00605 [Ktedonobacteraceae bacterium]|jgi:hypothetical protein|nr:hypothetical protein [Ktedonobacteraceae bacterium]
MPFNTLLLSCLQYGTSVTQKNVSVRAVPQKGETILFFKTDSEIACKDLHIMVGEPVCDYLVFYAKDGKTVLCLVELKGNDTDHAIEQVLSTYQHMQNQLSELRGKACWSPIQQITWKAYVCCSAKSSISPTKLYAARLGRTFKKGNFKITHEDELGEFLRK